MTARIKMKPKVNADAVRKYSCMVDKAFPAMDGSLRRMWATNDAMAAQWWGMEIEAVKDLGEGVMAINGEIWDGTYDDMADMLKSGEFHTLRINSEGGSAIAGVATYQLVRDNNLRVEVDGMAFSAASVIAAGGDPLVMKRGSTYGIHRPWGFFIGNADELREQAEFMDVLGEAMFEVYEGRVKSKAKRKEVYDLYQKDSLLNGAEAVRLGLADEYEADAKADSKAVLVDIKPVAAVDGGDSEVDNKADTEEPENPKTLNEFRLSAIRRSRGI